VISTHSTLRYLFFLRARGCNEGEPSDAGAEGFGPAGADPDPGFPDEVRAGAASSG
jgi:hypothetical protein